MYVSGGRLRGVLKQHAATIASVQLSRSTLVDGSWRSIAQALLKFPNLTELFLYDIHQKSAAKPLSDELMQSAPMVPTEYGLVDLIDAADVQRSLETLVIYFRTSQYDQQQHMPLGHCGRAPIKLRTFPTYYVVELFQLPDETERLDENTASKLEEIYAADVLGPQ
jgi:hypothetical protein